MGIVEQGAQLARSGIIGVAHARLQRSHVSVDDLLGQVDRAVVVLIRVARVAQDRIGKVFERYGHLHVPVGVTVRPVTFGPQTDGLSTHEVVDDMPAAVFERPRANLVKRVVECGLGRPDVGVHGRQARVDKNIGDPRLRHADPRF